MASLPQSLSSPPAIWRNGENIHLSLTHPVVDVPSDAADLAGLLDRCDTRDQSGRRRALTDQPYRFVVSTIVAR